MPTISLIAAVDEANGLGFNNQLLCHLPADLQHFKTITMGKPIIMGRSTFESIGRPLPGRLNIVLSRTLSAQDGILIFDSLDKALIHLQDIQELMVIGGAQLYAQTIELAQRIYLTRIHHQFQADVYFPIIDDRSWHCQNVEFRPQDDKNSYDMSFYTYEKKQ
ncbi:MAG: dihydrofolate reductase [Legionella sp.]|jgi:dihydrofolate reductase